MLTLSLIAIYCSNTLNVYMKNGKALPHYTKNGFRNPFPGFKQKGFGDFLYWKLFDRPKSSNSKKPDAYNLEVATNDVPFLKKNTTKFTITWIGHAALLIQINGINILTDPIWSNRASPTQYFGPKRYAPPGMRFDDLPEIHIVIISHDHYDHLDKLTCKKLGNKPRYLVPLGVGEILKDFDIVNYYEMDWWESITLKNLEIVCLPAQHFSGRSPFNRNETLWCSWLIWSKGQNFYFAGDTGYFPEFIRIQKTYGPIQIAALPIGAYMPRWFMKSVHMSPQEAVQAFLDLKASVFIPIHWGTFDLANEPLENPPSVLIEEVRKRSLSIKKFWIMKQGETRLVEE